MMKRETCRKKKILGHFENCVDEDDCGVTINCRLGLYRFRPSAYIREVSSSVELNEPFAWYDRELDQICRRSWTPCGRSYYAVFTDLRRLGDCDTLISGMDN